MQRKISPVALLGPLLLALASGCRGTLPPEEPPPFRGQTVRVSCPEGLGDLVVAQSRAWEARQQARVEVTSYPAGSPGADPAADALLFAPADLPRLVAGGRLQPLPRELTQRGNDFAWERLLPQYGEQLVLWDRVPYAVPVVGEAPLCVYRADLFDSPAWQKRYDAWRPKGRAGGATRLRAPATWGEFAELAAFFRDEHPSGRPAPSLPPLPADADGLERRFFQVAASYARRAVRHGQRGPDYLDDVFSFAFDQKTGAPRIASKGFAHALGLLVRLQACRPGGAESNPEDALTDGRAVLGIVEASAVAKLQRSAFRDRIGICAVPGAGVCYDARGERVAMKQGVNRIPYLGGAGWLAGVNPSSARSAAALDLLTDLAGPARSAQVAQEPRWGGGPTRANVLLRDRWDSFDLDPGRTAALRETLTRTLLSHGLDNPATVMRLPDRRAFRDALVSGIRRALSEKGRSDEPLGAVAREWQRLIDQRGVSAHRKDYRTGLGLLGD